MCGPTMYDNANENYSHYVISDDRRRLPIFLTTYVLRYLYVSINFIGTRLKTLDINYVWGFQAYNYNMEDLFKNIPTKILKQKLDSKIKTATDFDRYCITLVCEKN